MADEKIVIAELDINLDESIKESKRLKEEINSLKDRMKELKETQGDTSEEYIKANAELKSLQGELRSQEQITQKVISANKANAGSLDKLKAELAVVSKKWSALSEEERLNTEAGKKLSARKLELTEALKKEEIATGDARRNVGNYQQQVEQATGAVGQFSPAAGKATAGIKQMSAAFKALLANPVVAIIVGIIAALTALISSLKRSEEGQNALNKATAVLRSVLETILDVITTLAEKMVKAFKDPQQAVKDLWEAIKTNIANRVIALGETFVALGDIATNSFKVVSGAIYNWFHKTNKDLSEFKNNLGSAVGDLAKAQLQLVTGIDANRIIEGFKELGKEIEADARATARLADMQAKLDKQMRANIVQEQKDRLKLAQIKNEIDDKEKNDANERIRLIDEENKLLDEILKRNLNIAKAKYDIKVAQNALHKSTKADLDEQAALLADIYKLEVDITNQRKEAIAKRLEAQREAAGEAVKLLEYELNVYKEINKQKFQDYEKIFELEKAALDKQLETGLIKQNEYNLKLLELESQKNEAIKTQRLDVIQKNYDNELEVVKKNMFAVLDVELQGLEIKRQQEIEYAEKIGADIEKINKKYAQAEKEIEITKTNAKLELAAGFAGNLATIFGEQTALGKAAAIAETTINTYKSATGAYSALSPIPVVGPALGIAAAGAAIAAGLANVKKILAVDTSLQNVQSTVSSESQGTASPVSGAFVARQNVNPEIGAGIVSRQTYINNQDKITVQPTLVIDDVTGKQNTNNQINRTSVID